VLEVHGPVQHAATWMGEFRPNTNYDRNEEALDATEALSGFPQAELLLLFEGSKLMALHFDLERRPFSEPQEVKFLAGSAINLRPQDDSTVRSPGLVLARQESSSSVWLMQSPR
jgi:hypothetical protein